MTPKQQATALAETLALAALAGTMHDFHKREALRYKMQSDALLFGVHKLLDVKAKRRKKG